MKITTYTIIILHLFLKSNFALAQNEQSIRIGPNYSNVNSKLGYFFIYDGVPIFKHKEIRSIIKDTTDIDSIFFLKGIIKNCNNKPLYNAVIVITTKISINSGLKYIMSNTNNWILENPLAGISINGKKISWIRAFKKYLREITPEKIEKIEIINPLKEKRNCNNGMIILNVK